MKNEYNLPENIDIYDFNLIQDFAKSPPAIENSGEVYILKGNKILCTARVGSTYREQAIVYPESSESLDILKGDVLVKSLGRYAPFPFYINTGWYVFGRFDDSDEERGVGLTAVDKFSFDFGIASKFRYSHIPGFGCGLHKSKDKA